MSFSYKNHRNIHQKSYSYAMPTCGTVRTSVCKVKQLKNKQLTDIMFFLRRRFILYRK